MLLVDGISLVAGEPVEELLNIGVEAEFPGAVGGEEAEHFHSAIVSNVQIPIEPGKVYSRCFVANGVDAANACKPSKCQPRFE